MSDDSNKPSRPNSQYQQQMNQLQHQQQQFSTAPGAPLQSQTSAAQSQSILPKPDFFAGYRAEPDIYDENVDAEGSLRSHWHQLGQGLTRMGAANIEHRWKQIKRMVHQNGMAYSAYGDPTVREKHLQLDPLPHLIPARQWNEIETALKQRAELLNLMLADLYGPRTLLTSGVLPPDILFNHPHYQLPYHDLPTTCGKHLHFYAAELIRSPSGKWWVLADRTDSPGGSGFALENRIVISRAFPNEFRRGNVMRMAPYFNALREHLASCAKRNVENPHIAILSAGAGSKSYFEDSFLARYLGFTLVEINDLVVRSGSLMLKTLPGLAPIDVIMHRQQGNTIDPLELGGGAPGVAGILQVIRDENVAVVNVPGSGLVESPIFMAYLPRVCQALLQTDLLLPGVATWWGGEPDSLKLMIDRIDKINLLPAYRTRTVAGVSNDRENRNDADPKRVTPESMSRAERIALIQDNPSGWVGQEKFARSSSAVWEGGKLQTGFVSIRTFLTASGNDWHSMPGGLVRVSNSRYESNQDPFEVGGTKDAWVLADKPVEPLSLFKKTTEVLMPSRSNGLLPSRVADNLCWLGRYLERADSSARLLRAVLSRMTNENNPEEATELPVLIRTLALTGQIDSGYAIKDFSTKLPPLDQCLPTVSLDRSEPNSLRAMVDHVASIASRVRERLSNDAWRVVQQMSSIFESCDPKHCDLVDLLDITDTLIVNLAAFSGLVSETITRTHAFRFLNIGRRLEHSLQITGFLRHCFTQQQSVSNELLGAVLDISDSTMTYRSRYVANLQLPAVLDLLLVDEMNPRSLAFQLVELNSNLESLPGNAGHAHHSMERRLAMDALNTVRMLDPIEASRANAKGKRPALQNLLEKIESQLPAISTSISNRFLIHSGPLHQLIADGYSLPR